MKVFAFLLIGLSCLIGRQAMAESQPRGNLLELHSCELYAGGCVVSSEATLGGRYMLRAWNFAGGSFHGTELAGLNLAVLQSSSDNLADSKAKPGSVIVYLPDTATSGQRLVLLAWLKSSQSDLTAVDDLMTRTVPLKFAKAATGYEVSIGKFALIKTAPLESCVSGACGDALWYTPRAQTSVFTVAVDRSSQVDEPLMQLKWVDAGRRSVFLGRFGEETPAKSLYITTAELCGAASKVF